MTTKNDKTFFEKATGEPLPDSLRGNPGGKTATELYLGGGKIKKCKRCNKEFSPFNSLQKVCSAKCGILLARDNKKKKFRKIKKQAYSRSKTIKRLDRKVSEYIRGRDNGTCVICGSRYRPTNGHLIRRGKFSLRWDTRDDGNCHTQCWSCNYLHEKEAEHYTNWYVNKFGREAYNKLYDEAKETTHYKKHDLEEIEKEVDKKLELLYNNK